MSEGRMRSNRLTQTPWVFNWPKRRPIFVDLSEQESGRYAQDNAVKNQDANHSIRGRRNVSLFGSAMRGGRVLDSLDVHNERSKGKMLNTTETSDEDDDFVTPEEFFGQSGESVGTRVQGNIKRSRSNCDTNRTGDVNLFSKGADHGTKYRKRCNSNELMGTTTAGSTEGQCQRLSETWIAKDDDHGQKMWRINQRIVKLVVELMRNHETPESLIILASALDLLRRATDGMLVDGEACTLPQLELLEATARAIEPVLEWGESGAAVADGLSSLLKCRLPATVRCLYLAKKKKKTTTLSVSP